MATLKNFIYCLNATRTQGTNGAGDMVNAMGILSALTPEYIPGAFSFSIILSILDFDTEKKSSVSIILFSPTKEVFNSGEIELPLMPQDSSIMIPNEYTGMNLCMDLRNVILEEEGLYTTKVLLDGEEIGKSDIYVKGRRKIG